MNPASTVLVIDLGTSGPKVSVFDFDLNCLESAFVEVPLLLGKQEDGDGSSPESASESVEQSPSAWISGIESAIDRIRQKNAAALGR